MDREEQIIDQARLLIQRLEKISVDSIWARRSSGNRGALLRWVERADKPDGCLSDTDLITLDSLIQTGFFYLEKAASERFPNSTSPKQKPG